MVLVAPKHAGNVGAAARAMKNFGLHELYLVAPRCVVDREARAMAAHALDVLDAAVTVASLDAAIADRSLVVGTSARVRASPTHAAADPEAVLPRLRGERAALVFGPEDTGLDNDALDRCQYVVTLPTAPYASLNLAQAVVVLAYLWYRTAGAPAGSDAGITTAETAAASPPAGPPARPAERGQVEAMFAQLAHVMLRTGYTDERRLATVVRPLRRLLTRAGLEEEEVARLRGLWSQVAWALAQPRDRLPAVGSRPAEPSSPAEPPPPAPGRRRGDDPPDT